MWLIVVNDVVTKVQITVTLAQKVWVHFTKFPLKTFHSSRQQLTRPISRLEERQISASQVSDGKDQTGACDNT